MNYAFAGAAESANHTDHHVGRGHVAAASCGMRVTLRRPSFLAAISLESPMFPFSPRTRFTLVLLFAVLMLCYFAGEAHSGPVVRITQQTCQGGKCGNTMWSGTAIGRLNDGNVAVLTCAHGYNQQSPASVEIEEKKWVSSKFVAFDAAADLGLLSTPFPGRLEVYALADQAPVPGSAVISMGYPHGQKFRAQNTVMKGKTTTGLDVIEAPFIQGESGGCLLHERRLVGVIVLTQVPRFFGDRSDLDGFTQNWERVVQFVSSAGGVMVETDAEPYVRGQITFGDRKRSAPPIDAELGEAAPKPRVPAPHVPNGQQAPRPSPLAPEPREETEPPLPEIDWSLAKVLVLVKDKRTGNAWVDAVSGAAERVAEQDGVLNLARKAVKDKTGGRADIEAVFQRIHPERYKRILQEAGLGTDGDVHVVLLIKSQFSGPLSLVENLATSIVGKVKRSKFKDVDAEIVSEANAPSDFESIEDALDMQDATEPETPLEMILYRVLSAVAALYFGGKGVAKGLKKPAAPAPAAQPATAA